MKPGDSGFSAGKQPEPPSLFPVFLKLTGRACLVVGAGEVAQSKIEGLLASGAKIEVVAPQAAEAVQAWAGAGRIRWHARQFRPSDLAEGVFLVVVATSSRELNELVFREAQKRGVLCNVVDDPPHCDFYYPAVVRRGALQIAISTDGKSPALAQRLRRELEQEFGPVYQEWIEELGRERQRLFQQPIDPEMRKQRLHSMASRSSFEEYSGRQNRSGGAAEEAHSEREDAQ
ncbi:MAG TPA: bifunctional precorrin-2 dehydrogenase/sirohydrochlorin ferrochelatase [Terriglobia bacterium]